jgi:hypothetical protein
MGKLLTFGELGVVIRRRRGKRRRRKIMGKNNSLPRQLAGKPNKASQVSTWSLDHFIIFLALH